jgi:hypothetical protein
MAMDCHHCFDRRNVFALQTVDASAVECTICDLHGMICAENLAEKG